MIKRIIGHSASGLDLFSNEKWLDIEQLAEIELTSEDPDYPIEGALLPGGEGRGWRAAERGEQIIRLIFNQIIPLRRTKLQFIEDRVERTQEFVLRASSDIAGPFREIVRQQWNFSPPGTASEVEDYQVNLDQVKVLELALTPDVRANSTAIASMAVWRIA